MTSQIIIPIYYGGGDFSKNDIVTIKGIFILLVVINIITLIYSICKWRKYKSIYDSFFDFYLGCDLIFLNIFHLSMLIIYAAVLLILIGEQIGKLL